MDILSILFPLDAPVVFDRENLFPVQIHTANLCVQELDLRDIPSAICGNKENSHGIILAKSGPAKKYGIKAGEPLYQALKKCPTLVTAPPDYKLYVDASLKFISILKEIAPATVRSP